MTKRLARRPSDGGEAGYTLIELLLVLILLAVLVTIAFPTYVGFKTRAERRTAEANLRAAAPAAETYFADRETYSGMDLAALRAINPSVDNDGVNGVFVVSSSDTMYCLRSVKGSATYYKEGASGPITTTACT
jgi:prepilin-type N-terminal cleavage/methylation domain-containing protein